MFQVEGFQNISKKSLEWTKLFQGKRPSSFKDIAQGR